MQIEMRITLEEYFNQRHLSIGSFEELEAQWVLSLVQHHKRPALKSNLVTISGDHVKEYRRFLDETWRKSDLRNLPGGQWKHGFLFYEINSRMPIIVVEGMFDFVAIQPYYKNVVCLSSANGLTSCIDQLLQKYPSAQIYIAGDLWEATDVEISKLFNLEEKHRRHIYDARAYLKRTGLSDINDYIKGEHVPDIDKIISEAVCIENYLVSDVYWQVKSDFASKLFKFIDPQKLSFSLWQDLQEYIQEQMKYTNDFFIIPIKKIVLYGQDAVVEFQILWEVVCISQNNIQRLNINNEQLASWNKFEAELYKKNWLFYAGNAKERKEYLSWVKVTLDFFESNSLVPIEEIVQSLGFQWKNSQIFRALNGDYDFLEKTFTPKIYQCPQITSLMKFYPQENPDLALWVNKIVDGFSKIFRDSTCSNLFASYLFASIFRPEVRKIAGGFPLFFASWRRWLWKSFLNWLQLYAAGYDLSPDPRISLANISEPSLRTSLASINSLVVLDEYGYAGIKFDVSNSIDSLLLWNYDWLVSSRWNRPGGGLWTTNVSYSNEAAIVFSWMGQISSEAITTRTLIVNLQKSQINYLESGIEELRENLRIGFFNVLMLKSDININSLFNRALVWVNTLVPVTLDKRLKNNLATVAMLHMYDDKLLSGFEKTIQGYASKYDDLVSSCSTSSNIIFDIVNNPARYIDLKTMATERKKQGLYINKNHLIINIPQIIRQFKKHNFESFNTSVISEEIRWLLDLTWYWDANKMINYDLLKFKDGPGHSRRTKNYWVPLILVQKNKHLVQIYNAVLEKTKSDLVLLEHDKNFIGDLQAIYNAFDPYVDTLSILEEE